MYIESGASAQKENKRESSCKEQAAKQGVQVMVNVGDPKKCPECNALGRVVWVSEDRKKMGVKCPANHPAASKPESKFGWTVVTPTKTRRNVVFLTAVG